MIRLLGGNLGIFKLSVDGIKLKKIEDMKG